MYAEYRRSFNLSSEVYSKEKIIGSASSTS